jgi:aerobic C4-dicarboxylate transport protein
MATPVIPLDYTNRAQPKRDHTHILYILVLVAVGIGILIGFVAPEFAKQLKPLGDGFVKLIKMMIAPVIFCTIVLGVGSVRKASQVGKVGSLALVYFMVMSTVALAVGLLVGNVLHPGSGLHLTSEAAAKGKMTALGETVTTPQFLLNMIPDTLVGALTTQNVLQTLLVALLVGFAIQAMGRSGEPVLTAIGHFQKVVFRVLSMIMWVAPIGALGAMAAVLRGYGKP